MNYDKFGQSYLSEDELCDVLYRNPDADITQFLVEDPDLYNDSVIQEFADMKLLSKYHPYPDTYDIRVFDQVQQKTWYMPQEYKDLDIAEWVLSQCKTDAELQRVAEELLLYQERDLFNLLRYLKYFVDTMRKESVLWGLGRGSSVASYILYLIGVHRIDSMFYDLDIKEFLK